MASERPLTRLKSQKGLYYKDVCTVRTASKERVRDSGRLWTPSWRSSFADEVQRHDM